MAGTDLRLALVVALLACTPATSIAEEPASLIPVSARARLDIRLVTGSGTSPWPWDAQSNNALDGSRFMVDLTAGSGRTGVLYLKGAANWADVDDPSERVQAVIEQGDYLFRRGTRDRLVQVRVFGDERRFFTGELSAPSMDDDTIDRFEHRIGGVIRGAHDAWSGAVTVASLDDTGGKRDLARGAAAFSSRFAHVGLSFQRQGLYDDAESRLAHAEAGAWYRRVSLIASYAQSELDGVTGWNDGPFVGDGEPGAGWIDGMPDDAASSAELRVRNVALARLWLDMIYRYHAVGRDYVNDLAPSRPGAVSQQIGVFAAHSRYALDGRVFYRDENRFAWEDADVRTFEASARAFLRDNSQLLARGGLRQRAVQGVDEPDDGFVAGGYRRELQRFMGGAFVGVDGLGDDATARGGVETRVNWNATSAFYARWIVVDAGGRPSSPYARLEFRPSARAWVTLAYGWAGDGDGPFPLEDPVPSSRERDVLTLTVRGDF